MRISDWSSDVCSSDLRPEKKNLSPGERVAAKPSSIVPSTRPLAKRTSRIGWSTMIPAFIRCCCTNLGCETRHRPSARSEEHTSELQSLMRISYAVFCLKKKKTNKHNQIKKTPKHRQ